MPGVVTAYQTGVHASRPANGAGCILYSCTTHGLIYRDDGTSWTTFLTLPGVGLSDPMTTRGDLIYRNASNATARLPIGSAGTFLKSDGTDAAWAAVPAPTFCGWRVYNSGNISLSNGSETLLTYDSERYDSDTFHDTGSNTGRATIPSGKAGKYHVGLNVRVTGSPGDPSYALIQHVTTGPTAKTIALAFVANNASIPAINLSADWDAAVGDYFQAFVFVNASSKNATNNAAYSPEFWGHLIG